MNRILAIILVLILTTVIFIAGCPPPSQPGGSAQGPQIGKPAPDFTLPDLDGQSVSLSDFRGNPVFINFWASWCGPCRFEMPFIQGIFEDEEWSDKGLVVLGINMGESHATVKEFMDNHGLTFPVLLDTAQDVALDYNIRAIPTTVLIDKDGIIQVMKIGAFATKWEMEQALGQLE